MKTKHFFLAVGISLASAFIFSCSSDDSGGSEASYSYCIMANNTCLDGPFTASTCNGQLSNSCPFTGLSSSSGGNTSSSSGGSGGSSSSVGGGSSSSAEIQGGSSSSIEVVLCNRGGNTCFPAYVENCSLEEQCVSIDQFNPNITYGSLTDSRDGKSYRTVVIGTQTWMAENLNYDVPNNTTDACYLNLPVSCDIYGRLYNWATTMAFDQSCNSSECASQTQVKHQGICPSGWHIPSHTEWNLLLSFVGGGSTEGIYLKATTGWDENGNGTDDYGFSALPGGFTYYVRNNSFTGLSRHGYWWSSSEYDLNNTADGNSDNLAYNRYITYEEDVYNFTYSHKVELQSVRCVKDNN